MNKRNKTIATILLASELFALNACAKEVKCDEILKHYHEYENAETGITRLMKGENEYNGPYYRTDEYVIANDTYDSVVKEKLAIIKDNQDYLTKEMSSHPTSREEYSYEYIFGPTYSYSYQYNPINGEFEYCYGLHNEYHYEYVWKDIDVNNYTDNSVRDVCYRYRFYKINANGNVQAKLFDSLDDLEEGYNYFDPNNFVEKVYSKEYQLPTPTRTLSN